MSSARLEVTRRIFDDWGRGDFGAAVDLLDPHVVLVVRPEFPDPGVYVGPGEIAGYMRDLLDSWTEFAMHAERLHDAGDSVVVEVRQTGIGVSSGLVTELRYFQVWTYRGPAIIRIESIWERGQALEAAGLPA